MAIRSSILIKNIFLISALTVVVSIIWFSSKNSFRIPESVTFLYRDQLVSISIPVTSLLLQKNTLCQNRMIQLVFQLYQTLSDT